MHSTLWQIELLPWYAFSIVWLVGALWRKPAKTTEPFASRAFTMILLASAFVLLFPNQMNLGILNQHVLPQGPALEWFGIALTAAGAAIAIWARCVLGANWSGIVSLKDGHELIRSGPYAYVRHPIYTGLLLAATGTACVVDEWRGVPALVLVVLGLALKARREEQFLTAEFGEAYVWYCQSTGSLLPKIQKSAAIPRT